MTDEPLMSAVTTRVGSAVVLTVGGEVDLHSAPELVDTVVAALHLPGGGTPQGDPVAAVVADLTGVVFLSSAGLAPWPHCPPDSARTASRCGWSRARTGP